MLLLLALVSCKTESAAPAPLVAPGPAPAALVAPAWAAEGTVVGYWEGGQLSYDEVTKPMQRELDQLLSDYLMGRYDVEYNAAQQKIDEKLVEAEAAKRGMKAPEDLMKVEITDKTPAPTEAELDEAYAALQRKLRGQTKEQARDILVGAVTQKKQGERYMAFIQELRTKYKATVQLPFPDVPRIAVSADDDPSMGPATAPVTIVQFAEYQCGYCGKARESIDQVMKNYDGKVRFVFRDYPLDFHPNAIPAALAANCAAKQDKYWQVHDAFMANQQALSEPDLVRVAKGAGLNMDDWEACRKDPAMTEEIQKDFKDGQEAGVTGTPAFFINGVFINGAQPYEKFKVVVDAELVKKG